MSNIGLINKKLKQFVIRQRTIDITAVILFTLAAVVIATAVALLLLKSPLYGLLGIIPLFFFRPLTVIEGARTLEKKLNLKGTLVNSLQLACIPADSKEQYSRELISAYIDDAASTLKNVDFNKYLDTTPVRRAVFFFALACGISLVYPALWPTRFWYALNHRISYSVEPGSQHYLEGTDVAIRLSLNGVYVPPSVDLVLTQDNITTRERIAVHDAVATKTVTVSKTTNYAFRFLDRTTDEYWLTPFEPLHIGTLSFDLKYPAYTRLPPETKTGRQLIAPAGTQVIIRGSATQPLVTSQFILQDTVDLTCDGKEFTGAFSIQESGTATLRLESLSELKEQIIIYAIPNLSPLVDIFYPGYNINVPSDMELEIGIRCSDDYGLLRGVFYYTFESESTRALAVRKGSLEDTLYFTWDLSQLGLLPGDQLSYYAGVTDNAGQTSTSRTYYVYFPTMEEIYEEISEKEQFIEQDLAEMQSAHTREMEEMTRIREKIMKEREVQWTDQEKLREAIENEQGILNKIDEWHTELEKTIEKLNEGIVLDQESLERLHEITEIMQEIAPDELKQALERLQTALERKPQDVQNALENLKKHQEDLAAALKRTLELLRRFQQEQRLGELAQQAQEISERAEEIDELSKEEDLDLTDEITSLQQDIEDLAEGLEELAESEGLEEAIKEVLEKLAEQAQHTATTSSTTEQMKLDTKQLAADLQRLYEELTRGRTAQLRKNLLEVTNQLIDISKAQEQQLLSQSPADVEQQDQIISATKVVAESLYTQQTKSVYVTPSMGKNLAKAINHMEQAKQERAAHHAREAMKYLNVVCYEMFRNLEKASQGQSSTGMDQLLKELSMIAQGQASLGQSLSGFLPLPLAGLSAGQKTQLQRLAGKQRALREALQGLRTETGGTHYGDMLDHVIEEMQKTEEALYQYKIDRELIERQRQVLSKLLDAQRSIRKEDYGKKRKSKPGSDELVQQSPGPLPSELGRDELRELLQKALRETYPEEYEYYIREYFERLLGEK